jgi:prolyl-tRNA synthetase
MKKMSQIFVKTLKEAPTGEVSRNAQLLIRAGYTYKVMAGVYAYLPLGLKVLEKIKSIVRQEMNGIGGQELSMTSLQRKETWETTGRWDDDLVDVWFKTKLKDDSELGLAWSHEEPIMEMMQQYVKSYKDLPVSVYQFQTKLRNELRAKSGIMRGREFVMKDMYSLHANKEDLEAYYNDVIQAYKRIYDQLGIGNDTFVTFASGGAFTKFSHEFQTICEAGEDILYIHRGKNIAVNEEVLDDAVKELDINREDLEKVKSVEVGNIFNFGDEKSNQMNIKFTDKDGQIKPFYLASYGIGITRLMGAIVEKFNDERGIIWPSAIAPYDVVIIDLLNDVSDPTLNKVAKILEDKKLSVLVDDRSVSAGQKLADADLIGIPNRLVLSRKSLEAGGVAYKKRNEDEEKVISVEDLASLSF